MLRDGKPLCEILNTIEDTGSDTCSTLGDGSPVDTLQNSSATSSTSASTTSLGYSEAGGWPPAGLESLLIKHQLDPWHGMQAAPAEGNADYTPNGYDLPGHLGSTTCGEVEHTWQPTSFDLDLTLDTNSLVLEGMTEFG